MKREGLAGVLLAVSATAVAAEAVHPPIGIKVKLDRPSCVTLAIENAAGNRVRNIVVDEPLPAGENVVWWDAMDDHGQKNVRVHGGHDITGALVDPGTYTVRGIARDPVSISWKFCPYLPNNPVRTTDRTGQWLSDHTPPCSLCWLAGATNEIAVGSTIAEGAHALVWLTPRGRKVIGQTNTGTHYTGPSKLCAPKGPDPIPGFSAYGLGVSHDFLSIVALRPDHSTLQLALVKDEIFDKGMQFQNHDRRRTAHSLAVWGRTAVVGWPAHGVLRVFDLGDGRRDGAKAVGEIKVPEPRGLAFGDDGTLYAVSGDSILRLPSEVVKGLGKAVAGDGDSTVLVSGLDAPRDLIVEGGRMFVSLQGKTHQVWELNLSGKVVRKFGKPGAPKCGPYDEAKMQHPQGLMLTPSGELWVAEEDYRPKRLSVWDARTGAFVKAFYGPTQYGGGGKVDPKDPTRFYYYGMEFKLDWEKRTDRVVAVFDRGEEPLLAHAPHGLRPAVPNDPVYANGRQYFVNLWNAEPITGTELAEITRYDGDGVARPVAIVGQLSRAKALLDDPALRAKFTQRMIDRAVWDRRDPNKGWTAYNKGVDAIFAWSDLNDDALVQPEELTVAEGCAAGFNAVGTTLDLVAGDGLRIDVQRFTKSGVPVYDLAKAYGGGRFKAKAHQQVIVGRNGDWATTQYAPEIAVANGILTNADRSVKWAGGAYTGRTADGRTWFAPNAWSSLHAAQLFPTDRRPHPGEIVGATKINGPTFTLGPDGIECFALNSNSGIIYILSVDGYFVAPLFQHGFWSKPWGTHRLVYDEDISDRSSDGEGFYQAFTKCDDGRCVVQALNHTSSICEVKGLDSVRRLPPTAVTVTQADLEKAKEFYRDREGARLAKEGAKDLDCTVGGEPVVIDGKNDDWDDTEWAYLDEKVEAAVKTDGRSLFVAWHTCHKDLAANSGEDPWMNLFKTGGGLDLMIGARGKKGEVARPLRLLVAEVAGKPRALLYEPKSSKKGLRAGVSSPNRTLWFDAIDDVSARIRYAKAKCPFVTRSTKRGRFQLLHSVGTFYEISIPLKELGLAVKDGTDLAGDLGVLVGDGASVRQRLYWNNKGTQNLFDAPDEATLTPKLWGTLRFRAPEPADFTGVRVFDSETGGALNVSSGPRRGAGLRFEGEGALARRRIGTTGWALFRFDPMSLPGIDGHKGWGKSDTRWAAGEAVGWPAAITDPAAKDGLMHGASNPYRMMVIADGKVRKGHIGGGGCLAGSWEQPFKSASWDIALRDGKPHVVTVSVIDGGEKGWLDVVQGGKARRICDFTGEHPLRFLQFSVKGDFTLALGQEKWTRGEKRKLFYITGIFID